MAASDSAAAPLLPEEERVVLGGEGRCREWEEEGAACSFWEAVWKELGLLWYIAGPAILTSVLQYSTFSVTQTLVGHIGTLELAAVGTQSLVVSGIGFGVMVVEKLPSVPHHVNMYPSPNLRATI